MLKTIPVFIIFLFIYSGIAAQTPDSTLKKSPVKTLTDTQYTALLKGEDIYNMPPVALLNHYPTPDVAIQFKKEAGLSPAQIAKIEAIAKELKRKRIEMGGFIVTNEKKLDDLLSKGTDEGSIIFYGNRSGLYYGELRDAILVACYNTWKLLSPAQIKKLETLQNHN
ncbi:hypothetical protein [Mucilaginibacter ginsenosidivorax]|uniref:Uncharacterized protein n=1 Tax=Mucilaginibacter ginsenosidivorax TaxID=862126 RepID=A0A5B8VZP8_9SPHI|nr:hypothetical protein [Mucilaginibacter ginsenosidivorax]QEC76102.1 hypothetical protein FSB76_09140 [Mucilaginibacter ginsenosidivorax]